MPNFRPIFFLVGVLALVGAGVTLLPAAYLLLSGSTVKGDLGAFVIASIVALVIGVSMTWPTRDANFHLVPRQMYLLTVISWLTASLLGAIPFLLSSVDMSLTDAFFESVSGLTTTGSTVMAELDKVPRGILLWRALLQWIGGIGIVVMVVAIMPHLRVGGMRLFRAEASDKSEKFTARSSKVAQAVGAVYVALSILCAASYWFAGMNVFDAVVHSMTTVSTGGYSTSDLSMQQFASSAVLWTSAVFMFVSGLPLILVGQLMRGNTAPILQDQQVRGFISIVLIVSASICAWLVYSYAIPFSEALRIAVFNTVAILTTTGYTIVDYNLWGGFAVLAFLFMTFCGACAGSTAGGIKVFRFQIGAAVLQNHIRAMVHPRAVYSATFNQKPVSDEIMSSIVAFALVFAGTIGVLAIALGLTGLDLTTSLSGAATAVANVGPGLGDTIGPAGNFSSLPDSAKWLLALGMLMGRLEILTVLVLFTGVFWRG